MLCQYWLRFIAEPPHVRPRQRTRLDAPPRKLSAFIRRLGLRAAQAAGTALAGNARWPLGLYRTGCFVARFWLATGEALLPVRLTIAFVYRIALGLIAAAALALWQRRWRLAALAVPLALLLGAPYLPQYRCAGRRLRRAKHLQR